MSEKIKEAMRVISEAINEDDEYMRTWYCNIAMPIQDAGVDYVLSQKIATRLLSHFFKADSSGMERDYIKKYGKERIEG